MQQATTVKRVAVVEGEAYNLEGDVTSSGVEAWICVDEVCNEEPREVTEYRIEDVKRLTDADGNIVGFRCPLCRAAQTFETAERLRDDYCCCSNCGRTVVFTLPSE